MHALDPRRAPRPALVPGAHEHQEQPDACRRRSGRPARRGPGRCRAILRHPLAVGPQDLALVEQPPERFALADDAQVGQRLAEEPAVQQVHDRVFGATGVLVDRASSVGQLAVDRPTCRAATGSGTSTTRSPRTCPSCPSRDAPVRRTGGTSSRKASSWLSGLSPLGPRSRRVRQQDGKLVLRDRHDLHRPWQ